MAHRPTVRLIANDPSLYHRAAITLVEADYEVVDRDEADEAPGRSDLVLRQWGDGPPGLRQPSVPEITLDLALIRGPALVQVVDRVVGQRLPLRD